MKADIYNKKGEKAGSIDLPEAVFGLPWNADLVHQVTVSLAANKRSGTAHTKGRGDVRGGGKKPWRQKGTGQARHGSRRSPIWIGGGTTHGPINTRDWSKKINKKMRTKALFVALSRKLKDGQILFVDEVALSAIKTKEAAKILKGFEAVAGFKTLTTRKRNNIFLTVPKKDKTLTKSFGNLPYVHLDNLSQMTPLDVLNYRYLVIASPKESVEVLAGKMKK